MEAIAQSMYYGWSKDFLEAGKKRLADHTTRQATSYEVKALPRRGAAAERGVGRGDTGNRLLKKARST